MINFVLKNKSKFKNVLNSTSHAILIESDDTLLSNLVAKLYAMNLCCKSTVKPCCSCSDCLKIQNNNSVDTFFYPKNDDVIKVDEVNEIIENLNIVPLENEYKVYILNNFDNVNPLLQNKLLKTLEEPPKFVKIVLLVNNKANIIQTIVSRCECITLPKFNNDELKEYFNNDNLNNDVLIENCDGNLTLLKNLSTKTEFLENFNLVFDLLENMKNSGDILKYSSKLAKNKQNFLEIINILTSLLRDIMLINENSSNLIKNKSSYERLKKLSLEYSTIAILNIQKIINKINEKLKYNANINIIIDDLLLKMLEEKWKNK